tara:strand:+ start:218 stop:736 length:519 start_codon:yes stop_codon:yes gene_type:complete
MKKVIFILALMLLAVSFVGCEQEETPPMETNSLAKDFRQDISINNSRYDEAKVEFLNMAKSKDSNYKVNVNDQNAWKEYSYNIMSNSDIPFIQGFNQWRYHDASKKWYLSYISLDKNVSDNEFASRGPSCEWLCGEVNCPAGSCCMAYYSSHNGTSDLGGDGCKYVCLVIQE